ncbi:MAG: hypothetical protein GXY33_21195 [Phycisphaerae bacterium]|nr:hypothetical protein [Phycisphaerae bacterium]
MKAATAVFPEVLLLVDDQYLAGSEHVTRRFHQPAKHPENPLLESGQTPWEAKLFLFGSVRFDPIVNRYRMWYLATRFEESGKDSMPATALAESDDGIRWRRPGFDVLPARIDGKRVKTNQLFRSDRKERYIELGSVLIDPEAAKSKRYVMTYTRQSLLPDHDKNYGLAWSADGVRWRRGGIITSPYHGDRHNMVRDPQTGEYLLYFRGERPFARRFRTYDPWHRTVCLKSSPNLKDWSETVEVMGADRKDPPNTNIYSMMVGFRGRTLVGVYQLHYQHAEEEIVTTHLAWSHDRVTCHRHRDEFIALGGPGEWDRFNQAVSDRPLIVGETMCFYYSGRTYRHGGYEPQRTRPDSGPSWSAIGLATLPLDRFASLEASFDGGELTTKPMRLPKGKQLYLNAEARWGKVEVELTGKRGCQVIGGCAIENREGIKLPLDLHAVDEHEPVQLTVRLSNARIYAIYCE